MSQHPVAFRLLTTQVPNFSLVIRFVLMVEAFLYLKALKHALPVSFCVLHGVFYFVVQGCGILS